jgi:hypothetical protein
LSTTNHAVRVLLECNGARWRHHPFAPAIKQCSLIVELPVGRAEALFIAMAALVPTAGEQFTNQPALRLRVAPYSHVRHIG